MKSMCSSDYYHNGFVATNAIGYMMFGYTLLIPMNQRMISKLSKEHNISGHKRFTGVYIVFMNIQIYYAYLASVRF